MFKNRFTSPNVYIRCKSRQCHGRPHRGGQEQGVAPPPWKSKTKPLFGYILGIFSTFSSYGGLFTTFFSFTRGGVAFSPCGGLFATFLLHGGGLFWSCPSPTKISASAGHGQCNYYYCFVDKVIICTLLMCYY